MGRRRWCSDGFEIGCDNGEKVRVAFALACCDREAMGFLATTGGITRDDVRDLMLRPHSAIGDRTPMSLIHRPQHNAEVVNRPEIPS